MIRHRLTNEQWEGIKDLLPGKPGDPGRSGKNNRLFVDAIIWMARRNTLARPLAVLRKVEQRRWAKPGSGNAVALADYPRFRIDNPGDRTIAWRIEHEDPYCRRCPWQR